MSPAILLALVESTPELATCCKQICDFLDYQNPVTDGSRGRDPQTSTNLEEGREVGSYQSVGLHGVTHKDC